MIQGFCEDICIYLHRICMKFIYSMSFSSFLKCNGLQVGHTVLFPTIVGFFFFFSWPCYTAYGISFPQPGIKPMYPVVEAWSPKLWTTRESPNPGFMVHPWEHPTNGNVAQNGEIWNHQIWRSLKYIRNQTAGLLVLSWYYLFLIIVGKKLILHEFFHRWVGQGPKLGPLSCAISLLQPMLFLVKLGENEAPRSCIS